MHLCGQYTGATMIAVETDTLRAWLTSLDDVAFGPGSW